MGEWGEKGSIQKVKLWAARPVQIFFMCQCEWIVLGKVYF